VKIAYGTTREKTLLWGLFLLAAATSALALHRASLFTFPYLTLPIYLSLCALVLACLPASTSSGDVLSRWIYRALPALLLMSAIFHASSLTLSTDPSAGRTDLFFHVAEYFALGLLTARMVAPNMDPKDSWRSLSLALLIVAGYAVLDEIHQGFVPGRDPSVLDFVSDTAGGLLGTLAYRALFTGPETEPAG
jgi:VanZ family protein